MEHLDRNDRRVRALAEAQHGVVARRQLLALGLSPGRIRSWVDGGRLVRQRRGVYSPGHGMLSRNGQWMAAVLVCDERAVLSHRSAAALWGLRPSGGAHIELTVPLGGSTASGRNLLVHRSGLVHPRFITRCDGIPVTTLAWTLLDLAASVPAHHLRRAVERAEQLELFDLRAVRVALAVDPARPGSPALTALLKDMHAHGVTLTRSDAEAAMLQLCLDHRLPRPQVNHYDTRNEVDFRWPASRLIAEIDSWAFHRTRRSFACDRSRDRAALTAGWRTARFTATELEQDPTAVAAEIRELLRPDAP